MPILYNYGKTQTDFQKIGILIDMCHLTEKLRVTFELFNNKLLFLTFDVLHTKIE